jgi:large subunit ribosomal protein L23
MEPATVIRRPLVTEKTTFGVDVHKRYGFEVDAKATKPQIKHAVETLYGVRVLSVATQNRRGERRRTKFGWFIKGNMKKAIVKIHPDDKIELF